MTDVKGEEIRVSGNIGRAFFGLGLMAGIFTKVSDGLNVEDRQKFFEEMEIIKSVLEQAAKNE